MVVQPGRGRVEAGAIGRGSGLEARALAAGERALGGLPHLQSARAAHGPCEGRAAQGRVGAQSRARGCRKAARAGVQAGRRAARAAALVERAAAVHSAGVGVDAGVVLTGSEGVGARGSVEVAHGDAARGQEGARRGVRAPGQRGRSRFGLLNRLRAIVRVVGARPRAVLRDHRRREGRRGRRRGGARGGGGAASGSARQRGQQAGRRGRAGELGARHADRDRTVVGISSGGRSGGRHGAVAVRARAAQRRGAVVVAVGRRGEARRCGAAQRAAADRVHAASKVAAMGVVAVVVDGARDGAGALGRGARDTGAAGTARGLLRDVVVRGGRMAMAVTVAAVIAVVVGAVGLAAEEAEGRAAGWVGLAVGLSRQRLVRVVVLGAWRRARVVGEGARHDAVADLGDEPGAEAQAQRRPVERVHPLRRGSSLHERLRQLGVLHAEALALVVFAPGVLQAARVAQHGRGQVALVARRRGCAHRVEVELVALRSKE